MHSANKIEIHKVVYYDIRERFGLSAQLAVRAISKVAEAYKRDKSIKPEFRSDGSIVYDQRILTWKGLEHVSITTLQGRQLIPVRFGAYQRARMDRVRGQADLILVKGIFYLCVAVEVSEATPYDPVGVLGVDLGIKYLAVDSDGEIHSGEKISQTRDRLDSLKARLQSKGTKSAKRHLKKLSGRMARFSKDVNHCISKKLVAKAKDTLRSIALEDLEGIRSRVTVRKAQHRCLHTWNFWLLRTYVDYKAKIGGVPVVFVDPRNTSRTCPSCGHVSKANRPTRDEFRCESCGFAGLADHIAAINIASRAAVNQPIVSRLFAQVQTPIDGGLHARQFILNAIPRSLLRGIAFKINRLLMAGALFFRILSRAMADSLPPFGEAHFSEGARIQSCGHFGMWMEVYQ
jgi:IS605 OrfB family transposase